MWTSKGFVVVEENDERPGKPGGVRLCEEELDLGKAIEDTVAIQLTQGVDWA